MVSVVAMEANDITACFSKALSVRASVVPAPMLPVIIEVVMYCAEQYEPALKSGLQTPSYHLMSVISNGLALLSPHPKP